MKIRIALFFSILFVTFLVAPAVISLTENLQGIAIFIDINEDEGENNGYEATKIYSEVKIHSSIFLISFLTDPLEIKKNIRFNYKNYVSEFSKITTPPPKFIS